MKHLKLSFIALIFLTACAGKKSSSAVDSTAVSKIELDIPAPLTKQDDDVRGQYKPTEGSISNLKEKFSRTRSGDADGSSDNAKETQVRYAPPTVKQPAVDTAKKITKEGEIKFEASDVNQTRKNIMHRVQNLGGYIAEDQQTKDEGSGRKEYNLKVRVPSKNFDALLDTVSAAADKIDSRNISIKDVTAEYIDTKTRIETKKVLEARYLQLLQRATKMSDMLEIEDKLSDIRGDIEETQGQLNYMAKQVAYSSLDITFYTKSVVPQNSDGLGYRVKAAILGGWDFLQALFLGIIACWPGVIIAILALIWFNKRKNRKLVTNVE